MSIPPVLRSAPRSPPRRAAYWICAWLALAACGDGALGPEPGGEGGLQIQVAPLQLEQIGFACYDLKVHAITGFGPPLTTELVWERGEFFMNLADTQGNFGGDSETICSNQFGNGPGGDILYVGPCDATHSQHVVELVVDGLYRLTGARLAEGEDWLNPCPANNPCEFSAECTANADTPVIINLTVLRSANQGFFDIGVRFNEIFCSAKLDCSYASSDAEGETVQDPIMLVHNAEGEPDTTAVIGFACTAGAGPQDLTELYFTAPTITCGEAPEVMFDIGGVAWCHAGGSGAELNVFSDFYAAIEGSGGEEISVAQAFDTQHFTYSTTEGAQPVAAGYPLLATNNETYDFVIPVQTVTQDAVLAYAARNGTVSNPYFGLIESIHLGLLTRPVGSTTWTQLEILPGLDTATFAFDYLLDPVTLGLLVEANTVDAFGDVETEFRVFAWAPGPPPSYGLAYVTPAPPGFEGQAVSFVDGVGLSYVEPVPPNTGDPLWAVADVFAGPDAAVAINMASLTTVPTFVDGDTQAWVLSEIAEVAGVPSVLAHPTLLYRGEFDGPGGQSLDFAVILDLVDLGGGDFGLAPTLPPIEPDYGQVAQLGLDGLHGRGFAWTHEAAVGTQRRLTYFVDGQAPYGPDAWRTWQIPGFGPDLDWVHIDEIVEGAPGQPHLILGERDDELVFGYLPGPPTETSVVWLEAFTLPSSWGYYRVEAAQVIAGGLEILLRATALDDYPAWSAVLEVSYEGDGPTVSRFVHLPGAPLAARGAAFGRSLFGDPQWNSRADARFQYPDDGCASVYAGGGLMATPPSFDVDFEGLPLYWDLNAPLQESAEPPLGSLTAAPNTVSAGDAYVQAVNDALAQFNSDDPTLSVTLDPAIAEGYAWNPPLTPPADGPVFQYGVYYGTEALQCGGEPCNKKYMNFAIGIRPEYQDCVLRFEGTAAQPGFMQEGAAWELPANTAYPVITWEVNLTPSADGDDGGEVGLCWQHPLGGRGSGTQAVSMQGGSDEAPAFCYQLDTSGQSIQTLSSDLCPPPIP